MQLNNMWIIASDGVRSPDTQFLLSEGSIFPIFFLFWRKILIYEFAVRETLRVSRARCARLYETACVFSMINKCVFSLHYMSVYYVLRNSSKNHFITPLFTKPYLKSTYTTKSLYPPFPPRSSSLHPD